MADLKYAYYPGCSAAGTATEYDRSARAVCRVAGITLEDVPDWTCCGATPAHAADAALAGALSARNLRQAKKTGCDTVLTTCPSCLQNMKTTVRQLDDPQTAGDIEALLGAPAPKKMECRSVLEILWRELGAEGVKALTKNPLSGLTVACYYGCLLTRPAGLMEFDDPENPQSMETLLAAAGAHVLDFPLKVECCGASFGVTRRDIVSRLSGALLDEAARISADMLVVACPLCQMNLDLRQKQAAAARESDRAIPVAYITQLLGLAFGLPERELGFKALITSPMDVLGRLKCSPDAASPAASQDRSTP